MTAQDAVNAGLRFNDLNLRNIYAFILLSLVFGGMTVLSGDVHETEVYADMRKVMAIGYLLLSVPLLLLSLHFTARANAAFSLAGKLAADVPAIDSPTKGIFRGTNLLWVLFLMVAIMIAVSYIVLIYAVDKGLF